MKTVQLDRYIIRDAGYKTPCWLWTGTTCRGYARIKINKKGRPAHRVIYERETGIIIESGMKLDHLCGNKCCVNPEHLEQVSHSVNIKRSYDARKNNSHVSYGASKNLP
jgi:hypothetical protein